MPIQQFRILPIATEDFPADQVCQRFVGCDYGHAPIAQHTGDSLTPELRYRLAETWFNEGDWRRAILGFQTVIDNHPDSEWACWGYFRQGESMEAFQGLQQAGPFYQGATQGACKTSEAAKAAKKKL